MEDEYKIGSLYNPEVISKDIILPTVNIDGRREIFDITKSSYAIEVTSDEDFMIPFKFPPSISRLEIEKRLKKHFQSNKPLRLKLRFWWFKIDDGKQAFSELTITKKQFNELINLLKDLDIPIDSDEIRDFESLLKALTNQILERENEAYEDDELGDDKTWK